MARNDVELSEMERRDRKLLRKRLRLIFRSVTFVAVICVAVFGALCLLCRVKTVSLKNSTPYPSALFYEELGPHIGSSLILLDTSSDAKRLTVEYPYIKKAEISAKFPDGISVSLETTRALLSLALPDGRYLYLDGDLKVLELADAVKSDTLPVVGMKVEAYEVGAELSSEVNIEADTLLKIIKLTEKFGLRSRLTGIDMSKIYNIRLTLDSVISVELGNSEDLDRKISLVRQILDLNPIIQRSTVDVHDVEKGRYRIEN